MNRLTDIKVNGAGASALQFQYDALSRRTKLIYENGCSTSYGFEHDNDLNGLLHNFVGSNVNFSYAFDSVGQMLSQRTSDPANFRWTPGAPGTVSYGAANNINQYPTVGGTGFSYSTDGNLTNDGVFKYEFNTERMMTRVRDAGTNAIVADYLYDPALRQRQKNVGGTKTNFYYSGWQRLADYDGTTNTLQQRFVYGPGLDEVLIQISSGGTKTYFHGNHQGSVIATTDASGAVLNRFKYSPYGESPSMSGTSHGYTGQRYDAETGLYYYKMRHYSPKLGRFLQADPIGYAQGLNLYSYLGNTPLRASDPLGLYRTVEAAATAALWDERINFQVQGREWYGFIYQAGAAGIFYTEPALGPLPAPGAGAEIPAEMVNAAFSAAELEAEKVASTYVNKKNNEPYFIGVVGFYHVHTRTQTEFNNQKPGSLVQGKTGQGVYTFSQADVDAWSNANIQQRTQKNESWFSYLRTADYPDHLQYLAPDGNDPSGFSGVYGFKDRKSADMSSLYDQDHTKSFEGFDVTNISNGFIGGPRPSEILASASLPGLGSSTSSFTSTTIK